MTRQRPFSHVLQELVPCDRCPAVSFEPCVTSSGVRAAYPHACRWRAVRDVFMRHYVLGLEYAMHRLTNIPPTQHARDIAVDELRRSLAWHAENGWTL